MTTATAVKKSTRRPAVKKVETIRIEADGTTLDLQPGVYKKVGTRRIGKAFLEVGSNGSLGYVNRRGESRVLTSKEFLTIWKTGIDKLMAA